MATAPLLYQQDQERAIPRQNRIFRQIKPALPKTPSIDRTSHYKSADNSAAFFNTNVFPGSAERRSVRNRLRQTKNSSSRRLPAERIASAPGAPGLLRYPNQELTQDNRSRTQIKRSRTVPQVLTELCIRSPTHVSFRHRRRTKEGNKKKPGEARQHTGTYAYTCMEFCCV
jgi:hypothetical protein